MGPLPKWTCLGLGLWASCAFAQEPRPANASQPAYPTITADSPVASSGQAVRLGAPRVKGAAQSTGGYPVVIRSQSPSGVDIVPVIGFGTRVRTEEQYNCGVVSESAQVAQPITPPFGLPGGPPPGPLAPAPVCPPETGRARFIAGAGVYYVQPHFEANPAFTTTLGGGIAAVPATTAIFQRDFDWDYHFAPQAFVGFIGANGLGLRGRYWRFDESTDISAANGTGFSPITGGTTITDATGFLVSTTAGDLLTFESDLQLDVLDVEALQEIVRGPWTVTLSGGVRLADLRQSYTARLFNPGPAIETFDILQSNQRFKGIGPVAAAEVRRQLFNSGLAIYGSARAAVLFGTGERSSSLSETTAGALTDFSSFSSSRDDVMPVTELEIGAEYAFNFRNFQLFVRATYVGHVWFGAGSAASESGNLGFSGLGLVAGVSF